MVEKWGKRCEVRRVELLGRVNAVSHVCLSTRGPLQAVSHHNPHCSHKYNVMEHSLAGLDVLTPTRHYVDRLVYITLVYCAYAMSSLDKAWIS